MFNRILKLCNIGAKDAAESGKSEPTALETHDVVKGSLWKRPDILLIGAMCVVLLISVLLYKNSQAKLEQDGADYTVAMLMLRQENLSSAVEKLKEISQRGYGNTYTDLSNLELAKIWSSSAESKENVISLYKKVIENSSTVYRDYAVLLLAAYYLKNNMSEEFLSMEKNGKWLGNHNIFSSHLNEMKGAFLLAKHDIEEGKKALQAAVEEASSGEASARAEIILETMR